MKTWIALAGGMQALTPAGAALAQNGSMMNGGGGGMWGTGWMGGYGGFWGPVLLAIVVGLVVWIVMQRRK